MNNLTFTPLSENSLLLTWPEVICPEQHQQIISLEQQIKYHCKNSIICTVSAYNSLIIYYRLDKLSLTQLTQEIKQLALMPNKQQSVKANHVNIPVYYSNESAWDLLNVAKTTQLSVAEVIALHTSQTYRAYALGFMPGFCYLASVAKSLQLPRQHTPRTAVPAGSVAIAGEQTAVYPSASPGGWHIIGQTPIAMFTQSEDSFSSTINVGDTVSFSAIEREEFIHLGGVLSPLANR